jgi:phosphoserine phosphatase
MKQRMERLVDKFEWDEQGLQDVTRQAVRNFNDQMQPTLDELHQQVAGRPASEIKPLLASAWQAKAGQELPDDALDEWATLLEHGDRVVLTTNE